MHDKLKKPMLADDAGSRKPIYPCWIQPKIDGVRALNQNGILYARSLKQHENLHLTALFSKLEYNGFDGELILGDNPTMDDLCNLTSGATRRKDDNTSIFTWYIFDDIYCRDDYTTRYDSVEQRVKTLNNPQIKLMPMYLCKNEEEYQHYYKNFLLEGYEGIIRRNPFAPYKEGRSDKQMQVWREKPFVDFEFTIEKIIEGETNGNEKKTNELGRSSRSTVASGMTPNGLIGAIEGTLLKDVLSPVDGSLLLPKGMYVKVSAGSLTHAQRKHFFDNPSEILGTIGKASMFAINVKDKPRFPQLISFRSPVDLSD